MSETVNTIDSEQGTATGQKPKISFTVAVVLLVILTIISAVLLSLRLHDFIYMDDKEVGLKSGLEHNLDLFSIVYKNSSGEIVVSGAEGEKVVAPGTSVEYTLRLRNKDTRALDYQLNADMKFLSQYELPLKVRLLDDEDNYLLGSPTEWADVSELKGLACTDTILTEESHEFIFQWKWAFEGEDDAYDTFLGSVAEDVGIEVSMSVYAAANTSIKGSLMDSIWVDLFFVLLVLIVLIIAIILLVLPPLRKKLAEKKAAKLAADGLDADGADLDTDGLDDEDLAGAALAAEALDGEDLDADAEVDETEAETEESDTADMGDQAE